MSTPQALATTATLFLAVPTVFLAGWLALLFVAFPEIGGRGLVVVPIVLFALILACLAGCARTRDVFTGIVLVLGAVGLSGVLAYVTVIVTVGVSQY